VAICCTSAVLPLQVFIKMGFSAMSQNGADPVDSEVLPPPETVESGSIREAFPRTGELSAGEAKDEVAPNGGNGVVPAAEIPFHPLVNLLPIPDEARVRDMSVITSKVIAPAGSIRLPQMHRACLIMTGS
jgi:hypothetical protein